MGITYLLHGMHEMNGIAKQNEKVNKINKKFKEKWFQFYSEWARERMKKNHRCRKKKCII